MKGAGRAVLAIATVASVLTGLRGAAANAAAAPVPTAVTVESSTPSTGPAAGGTHVTITGTGFRSGAGAQYVEFTPPGGGIAGSSGTTMPVYGAVAYYGFDPDPEEATVVDDSTITLTTYSNINGVFDITVVMKDGTTTTPTAAARFTFTGAPTFRSVIPAKATFYGGQLLTLIGAGFSRSATVLFDEHDGEVFPNGNSLVVDDSTSQTPRSVSPNRMVVLAPPNAPGATKATVTVIQDSGNSATLPIALVLAPQLPAITLAAATHRATRGLGVVLTGRLTAGGVPIAGRDVVVTVRVGRATSTLGTVTTDDDGHYTLTHVQVAPVAVYAATASFGGDDSGRGAALSRARALVRL